MEYVEREVIGGSYWFESELVSENENFDPTTSSLEVITAMLLIIILVACD